jgi:hypothetical protein
MAGVVTVEPMNRFADTDLSETVGSWIHRGRCGAVASIVEIDADIGQRLELWFVGKNRHPLSVDSGGRLKKLIVAPVEAGAVVCICGEVVTIP